METTVTQSLDARLDPGYVRSTVEWALVEDAPHGDITSDACIDIDLRVDAAVVAKAPGVIAGVEFAREAFRQCGAECEIAVPDGGRVETGDVVVRITDAPARAICKAERVALNFLGHLSGVATAANAFTEAVKGTGATILDTRKTTPGLRMAEKAAVAAGGASNHRFGLSDAVLIKENHIRAAGGITEALSRAIRAVEAGTVVEIEVTTLDELREAMESGAKLVLLDNMDKDTMRRASAEAHAHGVKTEASGNVTLQNVREVAESGVDFISIGWITHSAPSLDLSLQVKQKPS